MNKFLVYVWRILRYFKPVRTFWITLAGLLPIMAVGIEQGNVGITGVDWLTALSGALVASIFNFIVLMSGGDSMWSEPKENTGVIEAKPVSVNEIENKDIIEQTGE